jgi:hypothetical protein
MKQQRFNYFLEYVYYLTFRPVNHRNTQKKSVINYKNNNEILDVLNLYESICNRYNKIPTLYGFTKFTGISHQTIYTMGNDNSSICSNLNNNVECNGSSDNFSSSNLELNKKIRELNFNSLKDRALGGDIGAIYLLKSEHGLIEKAQPAQAVNHTIVITADDLPKLGTLNSEKKDNN